MKLVKFVYLVRERRCDMLEKIMFYVDDKEKRTWAIEKSCFRPIIDESVQIGTYTYVVEDIRLITDPRKRITSMIDVFLSGDNDSSVLEKDGWILLSRLLDDATLIINKDGRCDCNCSSSCPLGKKPSTREEIMTSEETRCTEEELNSRGIKTIRSSVI